MDQSLGNQRSRARVDDARADLEVRSQVEPVGGEKQPGGGASAQNFQAASQTGGGGGDDGDLEDLEERLWRLAPNNQLACVAVVVLHILLYALIAVMCAFHDVVCKMAPVLGLAVPFVVCILVVLSCTVKTCCAHLTAA